MLLDAPVSGSVSTVEKGELTIMVGGDPSTLELARPVLDVLATNVFHVGALGAGATMKLAVNSLIHAVDVGLSEALVLAEKAGSIGSPPTRSSRRARPPPRSSSTSEVRSSVPTRPRRRS